MKTGMLLLLLFLGNFSFSSEMAHKNIQEILQLPVKNRISVLKSRPHFYFHHLESMLYSKFSSDEVKWKALTAMARIQPQKASSHIRLVARTGNWFLKNAALISMETINSEQALLWAVQFLNHPSLVLRTASVDLIRRQKATQYKKILWKKLNDKENFRNGKSLWIRYNILQALSDFSQKNDAPHFKKLLKEKDPRILATARQTLSRLLPHEYFKEAPSYKSMIGRTRTQSIEL